MADTSFVSQITTIAAAWLNQANKLVFWGRRPNVATTTGSANAQILTLETGSLYSAGTEADGDEFVFLAGFTNAAAMTLQVLQPSGTNVARAVQLNGVALTGGEVIAGQPYRVTRKSTTWQLTSLAGTAVGTSILQAATIAAVRTAINAMENVFTTRADLVRGGVGGVPERFAPSVAGQAAIFDGLDTVFGTPSVVTVRQTQRLGPVDSSGYNATLGAGAGLNFNVDASPTAVVLDFAAGSVDYTATLTADASNQGSLAASNTNYIHATYVSPTSVTWSNCLVPPQYGYAFDRTQYALLNFEGSNGATTTTDDFGNSWTLTNATISTTQFKFGSSALRIGGAAHRASTTEFTSFGDGSWTMQGWFRPDNAASGGTTVVAGATNGTGYGVFLQVDATGHLALYLSSDGGSWNIVNGTAGATALANNTWYRWRIVFDALAGTYRLYLSNNGAAETQEVSVSSTARICAVSLLSIGYSVLAAQGYHDAFRILRCAANTSTETPSASAPTITDYPVHFFSIPAWTMYEVTAASASAGTNPTLTSRVRQFNGEADTNGSGVTAVRNYALMGRYEAKQTSAASGSTGYSFSHNIGTRNIDAHVYIENVVSEYGYTPGDRVYDYLDGQPVINATIYGVWKWLNGRNTMQAVTTTNLLVPRPDSPGSLTAVAFANWRIGVTAKRAF